MHAVCILSQLTQLDISGGPTLESNLLRLEPVADLPRLRKLTLFRGHVTSEQLSGLHALEALYVLTACMESFDSLGALTRLRCLHLEVYAIDRYGVRPLGHLTNLTQWDPLSCPSCSFVDLTMAFVTNSDMQPCMPP